MKIISDVNCLSEVVETWDDFVRTYTENPFLLSSFLTKFVKYDSLRGWAPLILIFSAENQIVGVAPLATKKRFGIRYVRFSLVSGLFSDFVFEPKYRDLCIEKFYDLVFRKLNCQLAMLVMDSESPNLEKLVTRTGLNCIVKPMNGHCFLRVTSDWTQFENSRGKKFKQDFKRTERKLSSVGSWEIKHFDQRNQESEIIRRILNVESTSWKEDWRAKRKMHIDDYLTIIWEGALLAAKVEQNLNLSVYVLELNALPIAYLLVIQYHDITYFTKTSYNKQYRKFSPGVYILNIAIRDIMNTGKTKKIDFHTDLPFLSTWSSSSKPQTRIFLSRHKIFTSLVRFAMSSKPTKAILIFLSQFQI